LSLLSFGSNFSHSSILIFNLYFLNDHFIQPFGMGLILSSLSLPHLFLPLFVGYLIDQKGNIQLFTLLLLFLVIIGFVFYIITSACKIFVLLLLSLIIYSCGTSSITTIQRILLTIYTKVLL
jgi:MFS family permease